MRSKTISYGIDSIEIVALSKSDRKLALLIDHLGDLSYRLNTDTFSFLVGTIVGQMLSSRAAYAITARLNNLCKGDISVDTMLKFDRSALKNIGLSGLKTDYIINLASLYKSNHNFLCELSEMSDTEVISYLTSIRGIGPWSAKMYLIFSLGRLDVLPHEDGAFLQAYRWLYNSDNPKPSEISKVCLPWSPYTSLAALYLYRALDEGLTKDTTLTMKLRECL